MIIQIGILGFFIARILKLKVYLHLFENQNQIKKCGMRTSRIKSILIYISFHLYLSKNVIFIQPQKILLNQMLDSF